MSYYIDVVSVRIVSISNLERCHNLTTSSSLSGKHSQEGCTMVEVLLSGWTRYAPSMSKRGPCALGRACLAFLIERERKLLSCGRAIEFKTKFRYMFEMIEVPRYKGSVYFKSRSGKSKDPQRGPRLGCESIGSALFSFSAYLASQLANGIYRWIGGNRRT